MARNPGNGGRGKNRNNNNSNFIRRNDRIRAREIRLIGPSGSQIGIVSRDEGLALAKQAGLDLVEISANARPPVCRILDFGKYMYELSKKQKDNKSSTSRVKEVKFRVRIEQHDYMTKLRRAEAFLFKGSKLKLSLMFRGREMEHRELGFDVIKRAIEDLVHVGVADAPLVWPGATWVPRCLHWLKTSASWFTMRAKLLWMHMMTTKVMRMMVRTTTTKNEAILLQSFAVS